MIIALLMELLAVPEKGLAKTVADLDCVDVEIMIHNVFVNNNNNDNSIIVIMLLVVIISIIISSSSSSKQTNQESLPKWLRMFSAMSK